jgi:enoyl-CoA hydratase/carnithine racemase
MELDTMSFQSDERIGYLTLNRPSVMKALNYQGALDLNRAAERIRDDPHVRLVLIRGAGRAFCTGLDFKQLAVGETPHEYYEPGRWSIRCPSSPARGKAAAKDGMVVEGEAMHQRATLMTRGRVGYLTAKSGWEFVFAVYVNNVPMAQVDDLFVVDKDQGRRVEAIFNRH